TLMRLAVGMTSSALRKKLSPVARCLTPTAALPLWALTIGSRRAARLPSLGASAAGSASIREKKRGMGRGLSSGGRHFIGFDEEVLQFQAEPGQDILAVEDAGLADLTEIVGAPVHLACFGPRVDDPGELGAGEKQVSELAGDLSLGVPPAQNLDGQVGNEPG